jgi:hypothetical protein
MTMIGRTIGQERPSRWDILFRVLALLIVLLAAVNLAVYGLPLLERPEEPFPGQLLYVTTFDAYNEQWTQERGQARTIIADGTLLASSEAESDGIYSALDRDLGNFDLSVDVTWRQVPDDYGQFVVLFRLQDPEHYYAFRVRADGAYRVEVVNGNPSAPDVLSEWQISPHIRIGEGAVNRVRVVAQAFIFSFVVNDELLPLCLRGQDRRSTWTGPRTGECMSDGGRTRDEAVDRNFERGQIALGAYAVTPGLEVTFDNVLVVGPR